MTTFGEGFLSGVGHPLLGFDHLLFIVLVGVVGCALGRVLQITGTFIVAMAAGCAAASLTGVAVPVEFAVALTLVVLGAISIWTVPTTNSMLLLVSGLIHGAAFAGAMIGVEAQATQPVLTGYLLGLIIIQFAVALLAGWLVIQRDPFRGRSISEALDSLTFLKVRVTGAVIAGAGLLLVLENLEGPLLNALSLA